jgi:dolichyl-phosphate-mannose--protein O-mannosyl transferase
VCFSHDVKYGSGSGQQSVTGTGQQEDVNSHWTIKVSRCRRLELLSETPGDDAPCCQGPEEGDYCKRGEPVACGQRLRLEHLTTNRNLHSHHFTR